MDHRFTGVENMTVDSKGRVGIPARFMAVLRARCPEQADEVGIMITPDYSIKVLPVPDYEAELGRIEQLNEQIEDQRLLKSLTAMSADRLTLDRQNRIKLNPVLMKLCAISRDVMITGAFGHMEIYDEARWQELTTRNIARMSQAANKVATQGEPRPLPQKFYVALPVDGPGDAADADAARER